MYWNEELNQKLNLFLEPMDRRIPEEKSHFLGRTFSVYEVETVVKSLKRDKTPGSDGIQAEVLQELMKYAGQDLCDLLNLWRREDAIQPEFNKGLIKLIPKGQDKLEVKSFRPLTMLNTILRGSIHEAILNVITAIDWAAEQEDEYVMINMDLEKAYDRVSWEYILAVVERMGFGELFTGMVKTLFQNASATIQVNGYITESFQLARSIRQGCPLAPLLFVIVTDPLLRNVDLQLQKQTIKPLPLPQGQSFLAQLFDVDNCNIVKCEHSSIVALMQVYDDFCSVSGSRIAPHKIECLRLTYKEDNGVLNAFGLVDAGIGTIIRDAMKDQQPAFLLNPQLAKALEKKGHAVFKDIWDASSQDWGIDQRRWSAQKTREKILLSQVTQGIEDNWPTSCLVDTQPNTKNWDLKECKRPVHTQTWTASMATGWGKEGCFLTNELEESQPGQYAADGAKVPHTVLDVIHARKLSKMPFGAHIKKSSSKPSVDHSSPSPVRSPPPPPEKPEQKAALAQQELTIEKELPFINQPEKPTPLFPKITIIELTKKTEKLKAHEEKKTQEAIETQKTIASLVLEQLEVRLPSQSISSSEKSYDILVSESGGLELHEVPKSQKTPSPTSQQMEITTELPSMEVDKEGMQESSKQKGIGMAMSPKRRNQNKQELLMEQTAAPLEKAT
ncbi:hypothetical protein L7F22_036828 [Adiantum nelumboides]|nr:hypothetical protein [Adiantum nelumboides]